MADPVEVGEFSWRKWLWFFSSAHPGFKKLERTFASNWVVRVRLGTVEPMGMHSRPPVGVAAFVGRERERAKVADLVADARIVTLTGFGGCGPNWRYFGELRRGWGPGRF